jgi:arylamine N-acetyltransferase
MISDIQQLLYEHFSTIPFHNLDLLYGRPLQGGIPGGTCSDKTLAFLTDAKKLDVDAQLHSAFIGGQEIHRLVRLDFKGQVFFADVGNGWPALNLFPAYEGVSFKCFGMTYRSVVTENWVRVFHRRQGKESLQMEIDVIPKSEAEIQKQINSRYTSGIEYPFSQSLRFSLIVGNAFLFLRGNRLERYSVGRFSAIELSKRDIPNAIDSEFGFDVTSYFST